MPYAPFNPIVNAKYIGFGNGIFSGDSGNPFFILINNEPVLLGVLSNSGGSGSFVSSFITEINNTMSSLGGSYILSFIDLNSFSTY